MKTNLLQVSSKLLLSSLMLFFVALVALPGYASAAPGLNLSPAGGVTFAVSAANCSGNVVTASINGGSVTFTNKFEKDMAVGVASYKVIDSNIDTQQLYDSKIGTVPACGTLTLTVSVPDCNYQLDAFLGPVLQSMQGQRYGSRLLAAKDADPSNFCAETGAAVGDANATPKASSNQNSDVLTAVQIPGLPNTGLGNTSTDTGDSPNWLYISLIITLIGSTVTLLLFNRSKVQKKP
jgi:hypothetical protein